MTKVRCYWVYKALVCIPEMQCIKEGFHFAQNLTCRNVVKRTFGNVRPEKVQWRPWSDGVDAQTDLSFPRADVRRYVFPCYGSYSWQSFTGEILFTVSRIITKTCLYNFDPLKPHFYIVKLGFTGVYIIFLISAQKHRFWILVRTASPRRF